MGANVDKLFLELNGCPVVAHTWRQFEQADCVEEIVMVVREGMQEAFMELARKCGFRKKLRLVAGGKERQDSVWNGLESLPRSTEIVVIQTPPGLARASRSSRLRSRRRGKSARRLRRSRLPIR